MTDSPINLREYVDGRFEAQEKAVAAALAAAEKAVSAALMAADRAVSKAEVASDKRFESVNEFRGTLSDQAQKFLLRTEFDIAQRNVLEKVEGLQKFIWMGLGAVMTIQLFIGIVFTILKKP